MVYKYGMRLRGYSLFCQPSKGIINALEDPTGKYYNILRYSRPLTRKEMEDYELDYLGEEKTNT